MPAVKDVPAALGFRAKKEIRSRLVRSGRVPRYAYRHYFIEGEGLHSRVHMQNFYSVMWAHLDEPVMARVEVSAPDGRVVGARTYELPPFGGLFVEVRDLLTSLGSDLTEGSILVDAAPPAAVLEDLTSFDLPDQWDLLMGTPFWMAYYDANENYMYVHSISPEMGRFYGVPRPLGKLFIRESSATAGRWRAGRLIDVAGLADFQLVLLNHAGSTRETTVGIYDADDDSTVWSTEDSLDGHVVRRYVVPREALQSFAERKPQGRFRVGLDPLPTSNGKPYLLMRYADGPLSLHHG